MMTFKPSRLIGVLLMLAASTSPGFAFDASMSVTGPTSSPIGHVQFCAEHRGECGPFRQPNRIIKLNQRSFAELRRINQVVNTTVIPATDKEIYGTEERWSYPRLAGDCEDYVLEKRRELIAAGWPASALLITVVRDEIGDGHAVLTVRTDRGDLILDNKADEILLWGNTPYRFIKRQSTANAAQWDRIDDGREALVGSLR